LRCQPPCFKGGPSTTQDLRRRTEITPAKDSHTRIKLLDLASGYGRYMAVTPNGHFARWGIVVTYDRYKCVTVSIRERLRTGNGRFNSEMAAWIQKWFKIYISAGTSRKPYRFNSFPRRKQPYL
jgi:hypothetical protein